MNGNAAQAIALMNGLDTPQWLIPGIDVYTEAITEDEPPGATEARRKLQESLGKRQKPKNQDLVVNGVNFHFYDSRITKRSCRLDEDRIIDHVGT